LPISPVLPGLPTTDGPFVIAEAGVNHNGRIELAFELVDAAVEAGADAVKFQTFVPELVASPQAAKAEYQKVHNDGESQIEMIRALAIGENDFEKIAARCADRGILFLSTPFDRPSALFLRTLGVPAIKIPSGELTNLPFLTYLAGLGLPLIVSTGMATMGEVERAVAVIEAAGCRHFALLQCTSNYPAAPEDANLLAMRTMADAFGCPVGYSDHTLGADVAIAAVALGACIVEKHFTLDCTMTGPDHKASLEPRELKQMIQSLRLVAAARGSTKKWPAKSERNVMEVARRSLAVTRDLPAGVTIVDDDLIALRPGTGIDPSEAARVVGHRTRAAVSAHALLDWSVIE
jgi:N,N'-diacetyllegionaminate synthase